MEESEKVSRFAVGGMSCTNCVSLVEARLKALPGVTDVRVAYPAGVATIRHRGALDMAALAHAVADDGYTISDAANAVAPPRNTGRDHVEIAGVFAVVIGVALALQQNDALPTGVSVSETMSYGFAFVIGLIASVSSCMAVTGGLFVAAAAKFNAANQHLSERQRLLPHIYFNAGRLVSYALLGGAVGALGSGLLLSPRATGVVTLIASAAMILIGLQMLKLLPGLTRFVPRLPRAVGDRIQSFTHTRTAGAAFGLGALTFFLPCGFTQALQLYVLAKGDAVVGAVTMFAFALGTLPALLSLSALTSLTTGTVQRYFLRFAGAGVIVLGVFNIQSGLLLSGPGMAGAPNVADVSKSSPGPRVSTSSAVQRINMVVMGFNYLPNRFTVTEGQPVQWRIDGREAIGCGRMLVAPGLGIQEILSGDDATVISFVPTAPGKYDFNCGMGMMTPGSTITVLPKVKG